MKKALTEIEPVMLLPDLSHRQKEALIALRYAGVASLAQLSRVLVQDRSNTYKRLSVLVQKGFAMKFFRPGGVHYFALPAPVDKSLKTSVHEILTNLLQVSNQPAAPEKRDSAEPSSCSNAIA